ncbi:class I SAM-dependent methyltransferase [Microlunatus parietis]|uniref:Ubiquinone/menaquinone biosynthesis C-methylase UbiE n=1 Tax=Microlunatus parietis TaxID=682979 RepID=A0A7Y9LBY3_9ACTN|nr:class I SAM-dependent methyltransferase [Microlunatus parietis]NYE71323.1 ubiquinone/menaquinone biosynthesis C-methylase UbiE [Microlunatus parietis]
MTEELSVLWDREAPRFDDAADHGLRDPEVRAAWRELLVPLVGSEPQNVADLGCGTGSLAVLLAEAGHRVTGIDLAPEMIKRARAKAGSMTPTPEFLVADASVPPLPAGTFDVVLARHVLWAMPNPPTALANWIRLLTPAGRLILIEGCWSTGAGLAADACAQLVREQGRNLELRRLDDPAYWGGPITDERYLVHSPG